MSEELYVVVGINYVLGACESVEFDEDSTHVERICVVWDHELAKQQAEASLSDYDLTLVHVISEQVKVERVAKRLRALYAREDLLVKS